MSKAADPYYSRKQVPNEFVEHVGYTGLTPQEESDNRERKFSSADKGDLRNFSNPRYGGKLDPYYQRKQVPDALIHGVGETGLTKEEEYLNRERKYSVNGADVRKFSDSTKGFIHPTDDPYYGRKKLDKSQISGVGETNMTRAEEFESRENKASLFDLSSDPFQQIMGSGHRASISAAAAPVAAAAARRRSSAVAPDAAQAYHAHSGYTGDNRLETVESRVDEDQITPSTSTSGRGGVGATTAANPLSSNSVGNTTVRDNTGHQVGETGHTTFYDAATRDLDSVAPDQKV